MFQINILYYHYSNYSTQYNVEPSEIQVTKAGGGIISPENGWYKIPANSQISIISKTTLPLVLNKMDTRVARNATTVPFHESIYEDKSISWSLDTDLEISRVIDTGDINDIASLSKASSTVGEGINTYEVSL